MRNVTKRFFGAFTLVAIFAIPMSTAWASTSTDEVPTEKLWKVEVSGIGG